MERDETKTILISNNELQDFLDHLKKSSENQFGFTIDHLESSIGLSYDREYPSQSIFCLALLHEVLFNLKPSHVLWGKLKYAAFLLNISERKNVDFGMIYNIFYQIEEKVESQFVHWEDDSIREILEDEIASKVFPRKPEHFTEFGSLDVKPNVEELIENINPFTCNELEIKSEESKDYYNDNTEFYNDDYDNIHAGAFNCNRTTIKYEEDLLDEILEPKKRKKKAKNLITKKKILKTKKVKNESKSEKGKVKSEKGQWSNGSSYSEKVRQCKQCGFKAPYQLALDKHEFQVHQATRLCVQCGHVSTTYEDYISHDKTHLLQCEQCDRKVFGSLALKHHMNKIHEKKEQEKVSCDLCGVMISANSMKTHMFSKHGGLKDLKCELCSFVTNSKIILRAHKKSHFTPVKKCPECGGMFKALAKHYARSCSARKLERHDCHLCEKTFKYKHSLQNHINGQHLGLRFKCDQCEYSCKNRVTLRRHVVSKHENKPICSSCKVCGKITSNMEYHMRTYHIEEFLKETNI